MKLQIILLIALSIVLPNTLLAQECGIVYVSPLGASSGVAGTKANPASLAYGLTLVTPTDTRLWLETGTYSIDNAINIPANVTIEGGFTSGTWVKSNSNSTTISRSALNPDVANRALVALNANNVSGFRLQDLTITVANAPAGGYTTYGVRVAGCSSYNIVRCAVAAGNGSNGSAGSVGGNGVAGNNGAAGNIGRQDNQSNTPGGAGGAGGGAGAGAAGAAGGGNGGAGVAGATSTNPRAGGGGGGGGAGGQNRTNGGSGGNGGGVSGGLGANAAGGTGGIENGSCNDNNEGLCNSGNIMVGVAGGNGNSGAIGTTGNAGSISHAAGYFVPGNGTNGSDGFGGQGGKGGGAGAGERNVISFNGCTGGTGSGGGGGGGGGQGGAGGTGGTGGGGSFAIYVFNNGANGNIVDCALTAGTPGTGGVGGAGGLGAVGGTGGQGGPPDNGEVGCGGNGGNGGAGGNGGVGGSGSNGVAQALYEHTGGTAATVSNIASVPGNPPVVSVTNTGCVNQNVTFSATTSGNWNFGTGATPPTATGAGPHNVQYSTTGRRTVAYNGTNFTDYIDIFNSSAGSGNFISPGDTTIPVGCFHTFSSTQTGTNYNWIFNGASPATVSGPAEQVVDSVYFLSPGTYQVILELTTGTSCCGLLRDTILVTAVPNSINVSLAASTNTICVGSPITYTATPSNYQQYDFYINTTLAQSGTQSTYTTSLLQPGDSITVRSFDGICYSNPSATIFPTVNTPPNLVLVSSDADNIICAGESVTFTATPTGLGNYTFRDGNTVLQQNSSNTYTTTNLASGNAITVIAASNGCADTSSAIVTVVNASPTVTLVSSDADNTICTSDAVTFTASPSGLAQYDFFENGNLVQSSANNTYTTTTLANGTAVTVSATSNGCTGPTSTPINTTVIPYPTVTLVSSDADNTICAGEPVTFTASSAGLTSYTFLNGTTVLQQGPQNTFTTTLLATGNSVTVVGFNASCSDTSAAIVTVVNQTPVITVASSDADNTICAGESVTFTVTPLGLAQYDFFENNTSVQSSSSNTYTTSVLSNGTSLTASATNNGCTSTIPAAITITVNPYPVVTLSSSDTDNLICEGESVTFTASPAGLQQYEFYYLNLSQQVGPSNTYTTPSLLPGNQVSVVATQNGCADTSNVIGTQVIPAPVANAGNDQAACVDAAAVALAGTPAGGTWSGSVVTSGGSFDPAQAGVGNYNLVYTVVDGVTNCSDADTMVFTVNALPVIITGSDITICEGESAQLSASGGSAYSWSPTADLDDATIASPVASPIITTTYRVTVSSTAGCFAQDSLIVTVAPVPIASFSATTACAGDPTIFTNNSTVANNFTWDFGDGNSATDFDPAHIYTSGGSYNVTLVASTGTCADTATASINVFDKPIAAFTATPRETEVDGTPVAFDADTVGISTWLWDIGTGESFTQPNFTHVYQDTGLYSIGLIVANANGCTDTLLLPDYVRVVEPSRLFVPNAFTPNGDGRNDQLLIFGSGLNNIVFQIFDRWGEKVFETRDQNIGWDGTQNGKLAQPGVYVYKLTFNFPDLRLQSREGSITLIR